MDHEIQETVCSFIANYMLDQIRIIEDGIGYVLTGDDREIIHRVRIASRRLRNGIKLLQDCTPDEQVINWQDELGRITRRLSNARDLDIQINLISHAYEDHMDIRHKPGYRRLLLRLNQKRTKSQQKIEKAIQEMQEEEMLPQMHSQLEKWSVVKEIPSQPAPILFEQAYAAITQLLDDFLSYQKYIHSPNNADKLHAMRIAGKNLRYTLEIFAPLYGHALQPHIQIMQQLQEELGELHDNDVWLNWLPKFIEEEQAKITDYFGMDEPIQQLLPGFHHLIDDRKQAREENLLSIMSTWEILQGENAWQILKEIITSPIIDKILEEKKETEFKLILHAPGTPAVNEMDEFNMELTPDGLDDDSDSRTDLSDPQA